MTADKRQPVRRFQRCYFVYILSSLGGMLYVGLTNDRRKRVNQHKFGQFDGFTKKYKINRLMYFETYSDPKVAELREKQIKKFRREKKIALFADDNPQWKDLTPEIFVTIGIPRYDHPSTRKPRVPGTPATLRDFRKKPAIEADECL
jgi:putative endonuclease